MADPLTTSIATALVTGMTAALSDGTRTLLTKLATLIRDRLRRRSDQDTLDAAIRDPGDHDTIQRLADLISQHMREDPTFAQQLQALWRDINSTAGHNVTRSPTSSADRCTARPSRRATCKAA